MDLRKIEDEHDCCSSDEANKTNKIKVGFFLGLIILAGLFYYYSLKNRTELSEPKSEQISSEEGKLILPLRWGELGIKMISVGVLDPVQLKSLYGGKLRPEDQALLSEIYEEKIVMTEENSHLFLLLFWALGLGNKNDILEKGPMADYEDIGNFASTGGWTLAKGEAMDHYSRHPLLILTQEQQELVERTAKNIYRPCCNNSTYFPDCNHGLAMLGLLELMASQGISEEEMYRIALQVNSYWFPDTYSAMEKYFQNRGLDYRKANPKDILGAAYSSASGYQRVLSGIENSDDHPQGSSCGV